MSLIERELIAPGDDAMKSQFDITFPTGIPGGGNSTLITLRADETFDPPEEGAQTYPVWKKGQKIDKVGAAEEIEKTFTITIRIDQEYKVYDDLVRWRELAYNSKTGTPGKAGEYTTTAEVVSYDRDGSPVKRFTYKHTYLVKTKVTEFDNQSNEPSKVECTFMYAYREID